MDYTYYSLQLALESLFNRFVPITEVLTNKLNQFNEQGFDPSEYYLYGVSVGGHIAMQAGRDFGPKLIKTIDSMM